MAHDRSKSEMTDTATISRTELHEQEDEFGAHNERGPHARSVKMIERSVPAYASDLEMMRVAAQLSGLGRDDQASRTEHLGHRARLHKPSHSRGSADPETRPSTAIMSARSLAASWAQKRAIANPFHVEIPTSPPNEFANSRIRSTSASSPGTISAVPTATPPFATAGRLSFSPMSPSSLTFSANTSLPPPSRQY